MANSQKTPKDFNDYSDRFPKDVQQRLQKLRLTVKKAAPQAKEKISYGIPAFTLNGMLVWFAAFKNHIGFYPAPTGIEQFKKELAIYQKGKGTLQFPLDKPLPLGLITKIVKFRVKENLARAAAKGEKK